ncbi:MAG: hypothetical protein WAO78_06895, partial [Roseovarius sp.]
DYDGFDQGFEWNTENRLQLTEANIESSCGITITDGSFATVNTYSGPSQTYSSTTVQSISFNTTSTSYFLEISATSGISKSIEAIGDSTAPTCHIPHDCKRAS